ncbi:MAG: hypothetical protein CMG64_02715 [Candidatus Marinimicrobia bacterium]|nr:hypothetical protein [Candidatus Neomarinimicrobiota bacterium]
MSKNKKHSPNKSAGVMPIIYIGLFCTLTFALFSYKFFTSEGSNPNKRWCQNCQTYHDINDDNLDNEIWCENCQKWHAPNQESRNTIR